MRESHQLPQEFPRAHPPAQRRHQAMDPSLADDTIEDICQPLACAKSWRSPWRGRYNAPHPAWAQQRSQSPKSPPTHTPERVARAVVSLHLTSLPNGPGGGVTTIMPALAQQGLAPVPSRRTMYRRGRRRHTEVQERGARSSMSYDLSAPGCPSGTRCQRVTWAAPHPSLNLTGERGTFLLSLTRTVRGPRDVARSQQTA